MNKNMTKTITQANFMHSRPRKTNHRRNRHYPKPYEIVAVIVFGVLLSFLGFILITGLLYSNRPNPAQAYALQTQQALSTAVTPTPFQPIGGMIDPPANGQEPTIIPTVKTLQKPEGQVNILLLGSDVRPDDGGFRTDSIFWVSLNPRDGFVSAISFPRDLYVNIPGNGENRINVAFPRGGFDLLADTFEINFGVRPDHYVLVDFNGFKSVINNLGGITVQTEQNLTDSCAKWINPSGYCSVGPGPVHMNGEVALWYARSRYSSNDIERGRRGQEVIEAIFKRLMSLDVILKAPDLYNVYTSYTQTDLNLGDVVSLLPLASKINENGDVRNYVIGYDHAYDWITAQGAQVLVPDYELIQELMIEALSLE